MVNIFLISRSLENIFFRSKYIICKPTATKKKIQGKINNVCLVNPNESCPKLTKITINIKFNIVTSKANLSEMEFLYEVEILILLIHL